MPERDGNIDVFKGLLVMGMIYAHVVQFFSDFSIFPVTDILASYANIITFSGFVFSFGYVCHMAYYRNPFKEVYAKMFISSVKTLIAFYISGIYFRIFIDNRSLNWDTIVPILVLEDIPGWSEFLVSFSLFILVGLLLFKVFKILPEKKIIFWVTFVALLFTTFINYEKVAWNQMGLLIGSTHFASFPILQYMPFYLLGIYFARYKIHRFDMKILLGSAIATCIFIVFLMTHNYQLPGRFPPTIYWILSPMLFLYLYFLLSTWLSKHKKYTKFIHTFGENVLFYLLFSNILIFTLKSKHSLLLNAWESLGLTFIILLMITYFIHIIAKRKERLKI
jgi:hypothetical protein